jgi:hypothetical protein
MSKKLPPQRLFKSAAERLDKKAEKYRPGEEFSINLTRFERWRLRGYNLHYGYVMGLIQALSDDKKVAVLRVEITSKVIDEKSRPHRHLSIKVTATSPTP